MEDENTYLEGIGSLAKFIDSEMTVFERMKIRKESLIKITIALVFYVTIMTVFSFAI